MGSCAAKPPQAGRRGQGTAAAGSPPSPAAAGQLLHEEEGGRKEGGRSPRRRPDARAGTRPSGRSPPVQSIWAPRKRRSVHSPRGGRTHTALGEVLGRVEPACKTLERRVAVTGRVHAGCDIADDYEIYEEIGWGMCGAVRRALRRSDRAPAAVKTVSVAQPKQRAALLSEAEIFLSLDHPHIARVFDLYEDDTGVHLVMEYCAGGEVYRKLQQKGHYMEEDAANLLRQMLLPVRYLHSRGIAHRDLKLENFLYADRDGGGVTMGDEGGEDTLKMIDFGLSIARAHQGTTLRQACGTLSYMAPEVLTASDAGERGYDGLRADMWSVGVMAYMLLTGVPPFFAEAGTCDGYTQQVVETMILKGEYEMSGAAWERVSDPARAFVRSLLALDPQQRPTADAALRHRWLAGGPAEGEALPPQEPSHCVWLAPPPRAKRAASAGSPPRQTAAGGRLAGTLSALRRYAASSRLTRMALLSLSHALPSTELRDVQQDFEAFDSDGTGAVSSAVFKRVLAGHAERGNAYDNSDNDERLPLSPLFRALDTRNEGRVSYSDFVAALLPTRLRVHEHLIRDAFARLGGDEQTDKLTAVDLQEVLGVAPGVAQAFISEVSAEAGERQSVSFNEFLAVVCGEAGSPGAGDALPGADSRGSAGDPGTPSPFLRKSMRGGAAGAPGSFAVGVVGEALCGLLDREKSRTTLRAASSDGRSWACSFDGSPLRRGARTPGDAHSRPTSAPVSAQCSRDSRPAPAPRLQLPPILAAAERAGKPPASNTIPQAAPIALQAAA